jgi:Glycosyl transferase family 2.
VKLIILDGSDKRLDDPCLHSINIKYIHNKKGYYDRLLSSINYIETEFTILSCDDEFYLPSALLSCVEFLSQNTSFSSCGGRAIGFKTHENKVFFTNQYSKSENFNLKHNNPEERIIDHFSNYFPAHTYSVMRSNEWNKICKYVFEKEYNFFASMGLQIEYLVMISG